MSLLNTYENMVKSAQQTAEQEEIEKQAAAVVDERVEVLAKYAEAADGILAEEYGEDYTEEDVTKLASYMLDQDIQEEENMSKVAEYVEAGQVMARSFIEELANNTPDENVQ
ncbi:hypothetical protein H8D85_01655 [bacterium]|nr:hypothetical protein [bacterium]